ncbi:similar to Saccharomyces cerevisiae YMR204C INP1 Peripheral membrane protein of peroxisomes involved in peroxisomal inheritance [Maudiozyma saulgeensis]|uniref:Inheritance of peroxisomes protein 1 n=1 Tax=Maudiozyma saulgeensis TaxID=1789683 RepID=A0A1X7QYD5_9SACH|nr:similar to Saccharomyces cerevisiae YMR204C INP1 Peripheral membrane protein of peroxisomes involved in peroxisomal inheritance [Kazachstania saulgeensis]
MVEVEGNYNTASKSPFKSIKRALKFHKQHDRSTITQTIPSLEYNSYGKSQGSPIKAKTTTASSRKSKLSDNRKSAQRISLFYCDNVKVLHGALSTMTPTLEDFRYTTTSLLAMGPLEIYEIKTNSSCSKYLTIGKNSDIIHPLLPKLKVTKLIIHENGDVINSYYISFSNPSRFWEIQFPHCDDADHNQFESVISNFCRLMCLEDKDETQKVMHNENIDDDSKTINNESLDDLNYLLEDSDSDNDDTSDEKKIEKYNRNKTYGDSVFISNSRSEMLSSSKQINIQFRKVIEDVLPSPDTTLTQNKWTWKHSKYQNSSISDKNSHKMSYRRSLYISNTNTLFDLGSIKNNRRSVSGLSDYDTLVSLHNLRI